MEDKALPDFGLDIERVSYADGCKPNSLAMASSRWVVAMLRTAAPCQPLYRSK